MYLLYGCTPDGAAMVWELGRGLVTEVLPVWFPDQVGLAEVSMSKAPNPRIAPAPMSGASPLVWGDGEILWWWVLSFGLFLKKCSKHVWKHCHACYPAEEKLS